MNRANILALANFLEARGRKYFNMSNWYPDGGEPDHKCGTPACIGGSACILWPDVNDDNAGRNWLDTDLEKFARKLGLSVLKAHSLCYPSKWTDGRALAYSHVTLKNAVATLRRLANTGLVEFRRDER